MKLNPIFVILGLVLLIPSISSISYSDCSIYGNCKPIQVISSSSSGTSPGSCPAGYVVQNTTTSGVQCVLGGGGSMDYAYVNNNINNNVSAVVTNSSLLTTYNSTYSIWSYNMSPTSAMLDSIYGCEDGKILKRVGSVWECHNDDTGNYDYNQTIPSMAYTNSVNNSLASYINSVYLKIADMFSKIEIMNMIQGNRTSTSTLPIINITGIPSCTDTQVLTNRTGGLSCVEAGTSSTPTVSQESWVISQDFLTSSASVFDPFLGTAIAGGTLTAITSDAFHPGVTALRDGTTADAGYMIRTDVNAFLLGGGENATFIFKQNTVRNSSLYRMGFIDTGLNSTPRDGCWIEVNTSTNSLYGRCNSAGTNRTTASVTTISNGVWYQGYIYVNPAANNVTFTLFTYLGALAWSDSVTSGIPIAAGSETGFGVIATEATTDAAADIVQIDYMKLQMLNRTNVLRSAYGSNSTIKWSNDLLTISASVFDPLIGAALSSGTAVANNSDANHPGVMDVYDSTTANGGYSLLTSANSYLIAGGETGNLVFRQPYGVGNFTNYRFGFMDETTVGASSVDGCYFKVNSTLIAGSLRNNQTLWAVCASAGVNTTSQTNYSIQLGMWYKANFTVATGGSSVNFTLYNSTNSLVWTSTINNTIPTAAGRETAYGFIGGEGSTDAAKMVVELDYIDLIINRQVAR